MYIIFVEFKFSDDTVKKEVQPLEKLDSMEPPRQSIIVVTPPTGDTSAAQKIAINLDEETSEVSMSEKSFAMILLYK